MKMYPGSTWESHQVNAVWNPLKDTGTNMPYVSFAEKELGESPLYYNSLTAAALLIDKTVMPNFGHLPTGIIMGIINKGDQLGYIFPADFVVTAESASNKTIVVSEADAVFFKKGMTITAVKWLPRLNPWKSLVVRPQSLWTPMFLLPLLATPSSVAW